MNPKNNYYVQYQINNTVVSMKMYNTIPEINIYVTERIKGEILVIKKTARILR